MIAAIGSEHVLDSGYAYVGFVMVGVTIMFCTSLLVENIPKNRKYPVTWC